MAALVSGHSSTELTAQAHQVLASISSPLAKREVSVKSISGPSRHPRHVSACWDLDPWCHLSRFLFHLCIIMIHPTLKLGHLQLAAASFSNPERLNGAEAQLQHGCAASTSTVSLRVAEHYVRGSRELVVVEILQVRVWGGAGKIIAQRGRQALQAPPGSKVCKVLRTEKVKTPVALAGSQSMAVAIRSVSYRRRGLQMRGEGIGSLCHQQSPTRHAEWSQGEFHFTHPVGCSVRPSDFASTQVNSQSIRQVQSPSFSSGSEYHLAYSFSPFINWLIPKLYRSLG